MITMEHYKIKDFDKIILGNVINTANCKEVFKSFKELIIRQEFESTKRKLLGQKWINHFDLSSVRPGKVSRHLLGAKSTQEIRGITMILQFLSNSYLTFSVLSPKNKCVVCKKEADTPNHTWVCEKATIARSLREHLQRQLPEDGKEREEVRRPFVLYPTLALPCVPTSSPTSRSAASGPKGEGQGIQPVGRSGPEGGAGCEGEKTHLPQCVGHCDKTVCLCEGKQ